MTGDFSSRLRFAFRWSVGHLLVTIVVALLSAAVVFCIWYPAPWRQMLGVQSIFLLVVAVDVVCGPLLTLVLANPLKSRRERMLDVSLVALIQLGALAYGLVAVFSARPVMLVFDVDRFVVVTANEVEVEKLPDAMAGLQKLPWFRVRTVGLRQAQSTEEYLLSLEQSLQGLTQPMRPDWWRPIEEVRPDIQKKSKNLSELVAQRPDQRDLLQAAAMATGLSMEILRYLPLTSSKRFDWVVLLDNSGDIVGYAQVDGFD